MILCRVSYFNTADEVTKALEANKNNEEYKPIYQDIEQLGKEIKAIKQAINKLI